MVGAKILKTAFQERKQKVLEEHNKLLSRPNPRVDQYYNGIFHRYKFPVLTPGHTPVYWRYDYNFKTNPYFMERLEINSVFNAGAIEWKGKILMMPRIESNDVKSFFGIAESENGIDHFKFWDYPIVMPQTEEPDMNVYDIRLVEHEDGWIYGLFCAERKDQSKPYDSSAAIAKNGLARTKDLINWERLPDIISSSPQQRNCVLHPEFVNGQYAFYTRPMDGFIDTGGGGGIGWGTCQDIHYPKLENEIIIEPKKIPYCQGSQKRTGACSSKNRSRLVAYGTWRTPHCCRLAVRTLPVSVRPARTLESHPPPGKAFPCTGWH
jgi:4-O-beta-D-mannosyl-D-glucose phosphorylase